MKSIQLACIVLLIAMIGIRIAKTDPLEHNQPFAAGGAFDVAMSTVGNTRTIDPATLNTSWRQYRGSRSHGVSPRTDLPKTWAPDDNILWETELEGRGVSSPVSYFQRLFLTSSSGYGESLLEPGEVKYLKHHVYCINGNNGTTVWRRDIKGCLLTGELNHQIQRHGLASSSPVTDGENVYAFFGASGVYAFGPQGEFLWHADVGFEHHRYGSAASLITFGDLLIVNASAESGAVIALDLKSGDGIWRIDDVRNSWSTPVFAKNERDQTELVIADEGRIRGFHPNTGEPIWSCRGPEGYAASTPYIEHGICYYTAGLSKTLMAIKLGGEGDVTETHKLWETNNASRHTSPIYLTGFVYVLNESGVFKCFQASDGSLVHAQRTPCHSRVYSSPILAGNYFYLPIGDGRVFLCEANPDLKMVRDNQIDDQNPVLASLCPSANSMLIRTDNRLRCILESDRSKSTVKSNPQPTELIEVPARYELDTETGSLREYNRLLSEDPDIMTAALLAPIRDRLDYRQISSARDWLSTAAIPLHQLRQQQRSAYWARLRSDPDADDLQSQLVRLENQTLEVADQLRKQLAEHLQREIDEDIAGMAN